MYQFNYNQICKESKRIAHCTNPSTFTHNVWIYTVKNKSVKILAVSGRTVSKECLCFFFIYISVKTKQSSIVIYIYNLWYIWQMSVCKNFRRNCHFISQLSYNARFSTSRVIHFNNLWQSNTGFEEEPELPRAEITY